MVKYFIKNSSLHHSHSTIQFVVEGIHELTKRLYAPDSSNRNENEVNGYRIQSSSKNM